MAQHCSESNGASPGLETSLTLCSAETKNKEQCEVLFPLFGIGLWKSSSKT